MRFHRRQILAATPAAKNTVPRLISPRALEIGPISPHSPLPRLPRRAWPLIAPAMPTPPADDCYQLLICYYNATYFRADAPPISPQKCFFGVPHHIPGKHFRVAVMYRRSSDMPANNIDHGQSRLVAHINSRGRDDAGMAIILPHQMLDADCRDTSGMPPRLHFTQ